MAELRYLLLQT